MAFGRRRGAGAGATGSGIPRWAVAGATGCGIPFGRPTPNPNLAPNPPHPRAGPNPTLAPAVITQ
jgi:hypothetical protein